MTERRDDPEVARLERRLQEARAELEETKRRGAEREPLLATLTEHLRENRFAERLVAGLRETRRHA